MPYLPSFLNFDGSRFRCGGGDERSVMNALNDSVGWIHSRWLASSVTYCFPRLPDQSEPEPTGECCEGPVTFHMLIEHKLLMRRDRYVASNRSPLKPLLSSLKILKPPHEPHIARHSGWRTVAALPRGHQARQALQVEGMGHGGQPLGQLERPMTSREWSCLGVEEQVFGHWY